MEKFIDLTSIMRLLPVAACSTVGAIACRVFADKGDMSAMAVGFAAYTLSTWLWIGVLRGASLGFAVTANSILTTALLSVIGHHLFGDPLRLPQFIGMFFGALSVVFFSIQTEV